MQRVQGLGFALCVVLSGCGSDGDSETPRGSGPGLNSNEDGGTTEGTSTADSGQGGTETGTTGGTNGGQTGTTGPVGPTCDPSQARGLLSSADPVWTVAQLEACNAACEGVPDEEVGECLQAKCDDDVSSFQSCLAQNVQHCHINGGACEQELGDVFCCQNEAFNVCSRQTQDENEAFDCAISMCETEGDAYGGCADSVAGDACLNQAFEGCLFFPEDGTDGGVEPDDAIDGGVEPDDAIDGGVEPDGGAEDGPDPV